MSNDSMVDWVSISRDVAVRHPLYGFGGWMIVMFLTCSLYALNAATRLGVIARTDVSALPPETEVLVMTQIAGNSVLAIWGVTNIALMLLAHRALPASFIAWWIAFATFLFGDFLTIQSYTLFGHEVSAARYAGRLTGTLLFAAPWIPYVLISKRANVTFRSRVRPDDPILR
jgi:hypothetical protein